MNVVGTHDRIRCTSSLSLWREYDVKKRSELSLLNNLTHNRQNISQFTIRHLLMTIKLKCDSFSKWKICHVWRVQVDWCPKYAKRSEKMMNWIKKIESVLERNLNLNQWVRRKTYVSDFAFTEKTGSSWISQCDQKKNTRNISRCCWDFSGDDKRTFHEGDVNSINQISDQFFLEMHYIVESHHIHAVQWRINQHDLSYDDCFSYTRG